MNALAWWAVAATVGGAAASGAWLAARRRSRDLARRLAAAARDLEHLQAAFARFAPPEVVDGIATGNDGLPVGRREVTVLFADLMGFSAMSERLAPEVLVRVLSTHFQRMSQIVAYHRGHVAKFIGDGMMALFGAFEHNPWQGNDAAHAALEMLAALDEHSAALTAAGMPRLRMGIGIHRGVAVAGVVGSAELQEFTVIGATVNLAARIERLTRVHEVRALLTTEARAGLDPRFVLRELPSTPIRGMSAPVVTFSLEGFAQEAPPGRGGK